MMTLAMTHHCLPKNAPARARTSKHKRNAWAGIDRAQSLLPRCCGGMDGAEKGNDAMTHDSWLGGVAAFLIPSWLPVGGGSGMSVHITPMHSILSWAMLHFLT